MHMHQTTEFQNTQEMIEKAKLQSDTSTPFSVIFITGRKSARLQRIEKHYKKNQI